MEKINDQNKFFMLPAVADAGAVVIDASAYFEVSVRRDVVFVEKMSRGKMNTIVRITLKNSARVLYYVDLGTANNIQREFILEKNCQLEFHDVVNESGSGKNIYFLSGEGAFVNVSGVFLGKGDSRQKIVHLVTHAAPQTTSHIEVYGALDESAKAIYRGNITIQAGMTGCKGSQEAHILLLSKKAEIDARPDLDIANNDVRCSHAVTITRINEEKKFYLMSRGLNEDSAKKMILNGHFARL